MDLDTYDKKVSYWSYETVRELAKTRPDISNVLRGYTKRCFAVMGDLEEINEIIFAYIYVSNDEAAIALTLRFREQNFYEFLLLFSTHIVRDNSDLEIVNVYNTYLHSLMTFLGAHNIEPFFSADLDKLPRGGNLIVTSEFEVLKSVDRVKFYRDALGSYNYLNFVEHKEYVYIMMNKEDMTFKIGQSKKPGYREKTLQSKEPQIVLLKVWECDKKIEKELHFIYKRKRQRGEWFKLDFGELCEFNEVVNRLIESNGS